MAVGIVLIHGYSGSTEDLNPLAKALATRYEAGAVTNVCLPGHGSEEVPLFDRRAFIQCISEAVHIYQNEGRKIIIVGHSTGGVLSLAFLSEYALAPDLLILAAVPKRIDASYLERWHKHRSGEKEIPFSSLAKMISLINTTGSLKFTQEFPVLIIHGENDNLVLADEAFAWKKNSFAGALRLVLVPGANHNIFNGAKGALAVDVVLRVISDIHYVQRKKYKKIIKTLWAVEPESEGFIEASALSARHLVHSPSGQRLIGNNPSLQPVVGNEPIFANIEITTRCNLSCKYCARSFLGREGEDMPIERFKCILDMLPHAYRITLVGLGEPLLHPDVVEYVAEASNRKRRVAIVTNAMCLDASLSSELLKAGLDSIAFSIDAPNQDAAFGVRPGTDLNRITENIIKFVELSSLKQAISTAVFAAVSIKTASYLKQLIDVVRQLGVNVLMLTDLNFKENLEYSLWKNANHHMAMSIRDAVAYAFKKKLPVLSINGLEEFGLKHRYQDFLLLPPTKLFQRSRKRKWCYSPWQTIPVDVGGNATICDCQPEKLIGNVLDQPFSEIWNGERMIEYRRRMLEDDPPETCKICPRF